MQISSIILFGSIIVCWSEYILSCNVPNKKIFCKLRENSSSSILKIINFDLCFCSDIVLDLETTSSGLQINEDETEFLRKKSRKKGKGSTPSIYGAIPFQSVSNQKMEKLSAFLKRNNLKGIILKWENEDVQTMTTYLKELKSSLGNSSVSLLLSSQGTDSTFPVDLRNISSLVDFIILPVFYWDSFKDERHQGRIRRIADVDTLDSVIGNLLRWGVSKSKIVVTISTFGIQTTLDKDTIKSITRIPHSKVCSYRKAEGWNLEREIDQTSPFITKGNSGIAFEDEISLKLKSKFIILQKLAGIFAETISEDDIDGECKKEEYPLLESIYRVFTGKKYQNASTIDELKEYLNTSDSKTLTKRWGEVGPYENIGLQCTREGYYQYPGNCRLFYRCVKYHQLSDDFTVFHYACPPGLVFDERYEVCNWPSWSDRCIGSGEVVNVPKNKFICPGPGYFRDPENCRWFYYCSDHFINGPPRPYEFKCPYDLAYDEAKGLCNWRWLVPGCGAKGFEGIKRPIVPGPPIKTAEYGEFPGPFGPNWEQNIKVEKPILPLPNGPSGIPDVDISKEKLPPIQDSFGNNAQQKDKNSFFPPAAEKLPAITEVDSNKGLPFPATNTHDNFPDFLLEKLPVPIDTGGFHEGSILLHGGYVPCNCELDSLFYLKNPGWSTGFQSHQPDIHFNHPIVSTPKEVIPASLGHKLLLPLYTLRDAISQKKHLISNPFTKLKSFFHGIFSFITAGIPVTFFKSGTKFGGSPLTVTAPISHVPLPESKYTPPIVSSKPSPPINIFIINTGNKHEQFPVQQTVHSHPGIEIKHKLPIPGTEIIPPPVNSVKQIFHDYKYIPPIPVPIKAEDLEVKPPPLPEKPFEVESEKYRARPPPDVEEKDPIPDGKPESIEVPPPPPKPPLDGDDILPVKHIKYNQGNKYISSQARPWPIEEQPPPPPPSTEFNKGGITHVHSVKGYGYQLRPPLFEQDEDDDDQPPKRDIEGKKTRPFSPIRYYNGGYKFNSQMQSKPDSIPNQGGIPPPYESAKYTENCDEDRPLYPPQRPGSNFGDDISKVRPALYTSGYKDSISSPPLVQPGSETDKFPYPPKSISYYNERQKSLRVPPQEQYEDFESKEVPPPPPPPYLFKPPSSFRQTTEIIDGGAPPVAQSWRYQTDGRRKVETLSKYVVEDKTPEERKYSHYTDGDWNAGNRPKIDYSPNLVEDNVYPKSACTRPGLFRHFEDCNKFYECYWDKWINKFTLHSFECPVKLVFDESILGCSSPSIKIPCGKRRRK